MISGRDPWPRPANLNTAKCSGRIRRRNFLRNCSEFTKRCPKSRPKASLRPDAACWMHRSGVGVPAAVRRADSHRVTTWKNAGELFTFLQETLRQSDGVTLRSAMSPDCRSYLVDESWFSSRDRTWSSRGTFALVSDDPDIENSLPVHAVIVPRELVSSKPGVGPLWLVIPPH